MDQKYSCVILWQWDQIPLFLDDLCPESFSSDSIHLNMWNQPAPPLFILSTSDLSYLDRFKKMQVNY